MEYLALTIATAIICVPLGYRIGLTSRLDISDEVESAWDDGFAVGSDLDLNVGVSEFDLLIDDLNPVRKDPNYFKKSRGF